VSLSTIEDLGLKREGRVSVINSAEKQYSEISGIEGLCGSAVCGVETTPLTSMHSTILPPSGTHNAPIFASVSSPASCEKPSRATRRASAAASGWHTAWSVAPGRWVYNLGDDKCVCVRERERERERERGIGPGVIVMPDRGVQYHSIRLDSSYQHGFSKQHTERGFMRVGPWT
jgi:hypothetical protein